MGNPWRHSICEDCWEGRYPGRLVTRIGAEHRRQAFCCFCALPNSDGIFVPEVPDSNNLAKGHEALHALNEMENTEGAPDESS